MKTVHCFSFTSHLSNFFALLIQSQSNPDIPLRFLSSLFSGMYSGDWSSLLPEILETIARKLIIHADYIRFRAVCTSWRAATPETPTNLPCQLPWLMLSQSIDNGNRRAFLTFSNKLHYLNLPEASYPRRRCGSSHGWLTIVDESPRVFLINPLTRSIIDLPPLNTFANVVSFDLYNVGREYTVLHWGEGYDLWYSASLQEMRDHFIRKIVLSNTPSVESHFVALALIRNGELAYCKNGQNSWNLFPYCCEDVTFLNGLIFGVYKNGTVAVYDISGHSPKVQIIGNPDSQVFGGDILYLVNAMGELLLVTRFLGLIVGVEEHYRFKTTEFRVFRFNFSDLNWERLMSLGDKVLFLGENASLAFSASDYPGCIGNRIYFTDDFSEEDSEGLHGDHDLGFFNLEDGVVEPLSSYSQDSRYWLQLPPPIWITPNPCS